MDSDQAFDTSISRLIWTGIVPSKVNVLAWRIILDRVQTKENLKKRSIIANGGDEKCVLCDGAVETNNHLFFSCPIAYKVWGLCFNWVGLSAVFPMDAFCHLQQHLGWVHGKRKKKVWLVVWFATVWNIWVTRNRKVF